MPHDKNGKLIVENDTVVVEFKVKSITTSEQYCNVELESKEPMPPHGDKSIVWLNAAQVLKINK